MIEYQLVIRRVGAPCEVVNTTYETIYGAVAGRAELIAAYRARGFHGSRNGASHYRLTKFDVATMKRVRLDIFIRTNGFSRN